MVEAVLSEELIFEIYCLLLDPAVFVDHVEHVNCILHDVHRSSPHVNTLLHCLQFLGLRILGLIVEYILLFGHFFWILNVGNRVNLLHVLVLLLGVRNVHLRLHELEVFFNLLPAKNTPFIFDQIHLVSDGVEQSYMHEVLVENDVWLQLDQLGVVTVLVLKHIHLAEARHLLLKVLGCLQHHYLHNRPLAVVHVSHHSVVQIPDL